MNIEVQLDSHINQDVYKEIKKNIINILSQKGFSISETRYLFFDILERFDRTMPVTADLIDEYKANVIN